MMLKFHSKYKFDQIIGDSQLLSFYQQAFYESKIIILNFTICLYKFLVKIYTALEINCKNENLI